jgi:hypothetical protein
LLYHVAGVAGQEPWITLHFTPTSCSWLNLVECFFSVITRQAIRRGSFRSIKELTTAIGAFIQHPTPFAWTKDARPGGTARRWEPRRLRLRIFAIADRLARSGRRLPPATGSDPALGR